MTRRRSLSDEERALWTGIARSIKPLHRARKESAEPAEAIEAGNSSETVPTPRARTRRVATAPAAPEKDAPPLAPLGRKLKKRVARGREPIEARLDLHGFTQTQAHAALLRFLRRAQSDGVRIALVVTGKGASKRTDRHDGAPRAGHPQAAGADVAFTAGVSVTCCRLRGCASRSWRAGRALCPVAPRPLTRFLTLTIGKSARRRKTAMKVGENRFRGWSNLRHVRNRRRYAAEAPRNARRNAPTSEPLLRLRSGWRSSAKSAASGRDRHFSAADGREHFTE